MTRLSWLCPSLGFLLCCAHAAAAQSFTVPANLGDSATLARALPALAEWVLARYGDASLDRATMLDNLFRLQIAAGRFDSAARSVAELRRLRGGPADVQYEIWARAQARATRSGERFDRAFATAFREIFATLDDRTSALVIRAFSVEPQGLQGVVRRAVQGLNDRTEVTLLEAVALIRAWQRARTHADFAPLVAPLIAEDDARRYVTERNVQLRTSDGVIVCALVMRPRAARRLPALLTFTIYVDSAANVSDARRAASNAYVGVTGFTRGKACSPDTPVPYRYDGDDAAALIDWIAVQPWSDGRVGMYGGSYSGFTAWAAAKRMPKALRAIMVGAPVGPGIDVPMEGNIVWNFLYPWPLYTSTNKTLDNATYFDNARWFPIDSRLVRERAGVSRPRKDRRDPQSGVRRVDLAPLVRRVLARDGPVRRRVLEGHYPGAADRRVLLRPSGRGAVLFPAALRAQSRRPSLFAHRTVRPSPRPAGGRRRARRHRNHARGL